MSKNRNNFRFLSLILAVLFLATMMTGCGAKEEKKPEAATTAAATTETAAETTVIDDNQKALDQYTEEMKISAYLAGGCNPSASKDDLTAKYFKDKFKIDLADVTWPAGEDSVQKINTMAASGEIPDVLQYWSSPEVFNKLADGGLLQPVDELVEKYMPNYNKYVTKEILDTFRNPKDGKLYILPSFTVTPETASKIVIVNHVPLVRTDFASKLGNKPINTPDDLYDFLKGVKAADKDIIPLILLIGNDDVLNGGLNVIYNMFGIDPYLVKMDDTAQRLLEEWYLPEYLEAMKYLAKLYREDLMDKDMFTSKFQQSIEKVKAGRVVFTFGAPGWAVEWFNPALKDKVDGTFEPLKLPRKAGIEKTNYWIYSPFGWSMSCISKDVKDPVRLAKLIDWGFSDEGNMILWQGPPSKDQNIYDIRDGKVIYNRDVKDKADKKEITLNTGGWAYWFNLPRWGDDLDPAVIGEGGNGASNPIFSKAQQLNQDDIFMDLKMEKYKSAPKGTVYKEKFTSIQNLHKKWQAQMIIKAKTDADVESMYKQMVQELEKAGCIEVEKENYKIYKEVNSK